MSRYQTPYLQYFDAAGKPLAGGKLFFYEAGTNDLKTVFTDIDQTIPSVNPVTLNANGSVSNIFYSGLARVVLQNATGTQIFDIDDVGPEDLAGLPPLYVSDATYSLNDVVKTADGLYYRSIQSGNAGNTPSPSSEYWEKIDFIYTYNANNSYQIDDVVKFGGQLYISTIAANQGNSPATSNNWRKLTTLAEFEYLDGGLTLNKVNYAVGTKAHVKSYSAATGGRESYWVKQATTGPATKTPAERLDLQCTDALGAVWSLQHSGTVYISSIGGDEGADNGLVFRAYDDKADYLDLEGKTWPCTSLSTDNGAGREILQSKVFNGKLVVTNGLNGETNVQAFAPFLESEVQLSETKSPIVDWTGLNVLWLGTSIPHQAVGVDGYPERLAEKLNFTVQNWAWSGSHAFYDIDGDAFDSGTIRALSMTEADRLAGLATYGSSSAYDDNFDIVTKASEMTTEYRIKRQFESGAIDCVVLDHNHNDRKNIAGYTANDKTINAVVKGTSTTFTLDDVGGLFEGDGCYVRVEGIDELDYAAGRITGISGSQVTVAIDSSGMTGAFTSGEFKFVDRNTVDGAFDFLIAYTKNMFIRYGNAEGKIILCGAPSYFTNDVDRDHAIWSVNRSIKAIADKWELSFFDVANALRLTYRDHVTYLPDDVHPSTPETRKVFANIWAKWMNGGEGNFYNPEEVLQRNKLIDNENNQPALYSKYDQSFATRDVIYTEDDPLIDEDFSGGLGAWTQLGTGTPTVVSAPWGSGDAVQFDVLADNTAPYIRQNAAVGATPVLEFDFYMPSVDVATGTTQQVTIASINAAGGAGYSVGIIQTVGGATQLRATYNQGGFGAAPVVPLPGATLTITDATKYRVKIDVVDGYIFFSVDGNKLYAGALDNSLLGAASSVLVGPTFTNMSSAFSVFIGNVVAGAKSEGTLLTTEEIQSALKSYTSKCIVTPEMFGAVGDGVSDDYEALQAAFSHPATAFLNGNYYTSQGLTVPSDKTIEGNAVSRISVPSGTLNVISVLSKDNVSIFGIGVVAGGDSSSYSNGSGIYINNSTNVRVDKCRVSNHRGAGVNVYGSTNCVVTRNHFTNSPVQHLDANSRVLADIAVVYNSKSTVISGNICESGQGTGIQVQSIVSQGDNSRHVIDGNIIRGCKSYGIIAYRQEADYLQDVVELVVISNNVIENTYGTILNEATNSYAYGCGIYVQGAEGTVVSGNTVRESHSGGSIIAPETFAETLSPAAIGCVNAKSVNITGNVVEDSGMIGIEAALADNGDPDGMTIISSNTVTRTGNIAGIRIRERSGVTVSGNTISESVGAGLRVVSSLGQLSSVAIKSNNIKGSSSFSARISNVDYVDFSGNTLDEPAITGASFTDCVSPKVVGNTVRNHVTRGIEITSSCSGNSGILSDNAVIGNGSSQVGYRVDALMEIGKSNKTEGCLTDFDGSYSVLRKFYDSDFISTSGATETDLSSVEIPSNTLVNNGDGFNLKTFGSTANNANAKALKVYIGAVEVAQFSLTTGQVSDWSVEVDLVRRADDSQRCFVKLTQGGSTTKTDVKYANPNQDESLPIEIKVTGTGTASFDIVKALSNGELIKFN